MQNSCSPKKKAENKRQEFFYEQAIIESLRDKESCLKALNNLNDWRFFLDRLFTEGVDGLFFESISGYGCRDQIPDWVLRELKINYIRNSGRNMFIKNAGIDVLNSFEVNKIKTLVLRGMSFILDIYQSPGTRSMSDIDLVVQNEDMEKIKTLLKSLGFSHPINYQNLFENGSLFIDLHTDYLSSYLKSGSASIKDVIIWDNAIAFVEGCKYVRTLSEYDSIIFCCAHLQEHSFARLIWFYDIAALIKKNRRLNWGRLIERANCLGLEKPVYYVLMFFMSEWMMEVPKEIMDRLSGIRMSFFEKRSLNILINGKRSKVSGELLYLAAIKGIRGKLAAIWKILFINKSSFHLAVEKVTIWHYVKRFFVLSMYGFKKIFSILTA